MQKRKFSSKREAILRCVRSTDTHPTADWVFNRLRSEHPDLSLGTVYRNLALFKSTGEIQSLGVMGGHERFDGKTVPHAHFYCTGCGRVMDLAEVELPEELLRRASQIAHGTIQGYQLAFSGLCPDCAPEEIM